MLIKKSSMKYATVKIYSLSGRTISVPDWHRGYVWSVKEGQSILEEINEAVKSNAVLNYCSVYAYDDNDQLIIADGVQRIITFDILIRCLRDYASKHGLSLNIRNFNIRFFDVSEQKAWQKLQTGTLPSQYSKMYKHLYKFVERIASIGKTAELEHVLTCNTYFDIFSIPYENALDFYFYQNGVYSLPYTHNNLNGEELRKYYRTTD